MIGFVATVVAAGLTSFYSWRLVFMTFFGHRAAHAVTDHADDEPTARCSMTITRTDHA